MESFSNASRVVITNPEHPLVGRAGTVWRWLRRDESAWVTMDEDIPEGMARFPVGDPRRNNVNLFPEDCEPLEGRDDA